MGWLFLILFIAALALSFTPPARRSDKPFGIFCALLLMTAAGVYTAKTGIDLTMSILARTVNSAADTAANDLREVPAVFPSLAGCIVRTVLLIPLTILTAVRVIKNQFIEKDYDMEDAARRRLTLTISAAALMLVMLIGAAVMLIVNADKLIVLGITAGAALFILLLITLICPFFVLMLAAAAGVGLMGFLYLLSVPIMLYFAASALYMLTIVCTIGLTVSAMKLTNIKKPWFILLILLSLVPFGNIAVYYVIPALEKKYRTAGCGYR